MIHGKLSVVGNVYYIILSKTTQNGIYALMTFMLFISFLIYGQGLEAAWGKKKTGDSL